MMKTNSYLKCTKTKVFKSNFAQYTWEIIVTQTKQHIVDTIHKPNLYIVYNA